MLAAMMATASWGIDNSLSRELDERDPSQVVMCKAAIGTALTTVLAWINGKSVPNLFSVAGLHSGCHGIGIEFALLFARAKCFWRDPDRLRFCFCAIHWCVAGLCHGGSVFRGVDGRGRLAHAIGCCFALGINHEHVHAHELLRHRHAHVPNAHHQHDH